MKGRGRYVHNDLDRGGINIVDIDTRELLGVTAAASFATGSQATKTLHHSRKSIVPANKQEITILKNGNY